MIDFFASEPHYRAHLEPIADELGARFVDRRELSRGPGLVVVASARDLLSAGSRPSVLVEHGAGQTYSGVITGSYAGGAGRENVRLFVCPSDRVAALNRARYPAARYAVVGCPRLDRYAGIAPTGSAVALAFHWACRIAPEARTAFPHYAGVLADVNVAFDQVIGHSHPRIFRRLSAEYAARGIEPVADADEVFARASVLVVDNSSIGFEAMAVGIPVVWLNAPWYRRTVEHGLRFWKYADAGVQVDHPSDLIGGIREALRGGRSERAKAAVDDVYGAQDGKAAWRAAEAIRELV